MTEHEAEMRAQAAAMPSGEKPHLACLARHNKATPEGKYLVKRRDGTIPEWPSFVLGARDPHAEAALRAYADSIEKDPGCHPDLPASIRRLADEFAAYRAEHGNGDPTRGLHRIDDPATIAEMRKGPQCLTCSAHEVGRENDSRPGVDPSPVSQDRISRLTGGMDRRKEESRSVSV